MWRFRADGAEQRQAVRRNDGAQIAFSKSHQSLTKVAIMLDLKPFHRAVSDTCHHRKKQFVFAREIPLKGPFGAADDRYYIVHRRPGEPFLEKDRGGGGDDLL